ncbi:electron transport complex protein RnfC [Parasporobacterium paucivorans DSM 15970]|uniref:Ion-translocating oxidoreductase complex subunit C n=1 Tax=Parasporobacterium paucivorans DSM 15970 TaxID=1122934 RepID=A0A1M6CZF7_9FIRM|nr:electron transport complex subunit RsxC [Parasporobacterium paucivorans]SHI66251.1 electron transport complex protein RnfC [Parasporobacterium paucivorans DSM 15970]
MEDYTKFKLKRREELDAVLADKDDLFVVACNKCFKELVSFDEPDCGLFEDIAREQGKNVVGRAKIDFLCNEPLTTKSFQGLLPEGTKNVFVSSCGLGIQTITGLAEIPVYAASDTIAVDGHHGMALTTTLCGACGQCYLNMTGGICPIVDCSKSLLNGQCGGAKNGKCEVDKEMDCGWQLIYERLEKQGRLDELLNQPVEIRDYSKVNFKFVSEYVKSVRENRYEGYYGGIHPVEHKELSDHLALVRFPDPLTLVVPMAQHTGAPAQPIVEIGQHVKMGQKIAEAQGFVSSPIHASVSGTVVAIEMRPHTVNGTETLSIIIQSDGMNTLHESVKPAGELESLTPDEIIEIVRDKGIVGMGGAGFPTAVKLKAPKPIDLVLLNGCECEPVLTADHRVLLEYADEVIYGLKAMMKASGAEKGVIAIEDNKPDAVELLQEKTADMPNIEIVTAKTKYPQGAEKMLIKRVMGREVPRGGLPMDVGAVVANVSTAKAVSDAIQKGMPLIERAVSVSGERMINPGNYIVKNGTSVKEIINYCGGVEGDDVTIKIGGPMMGIKIENLNVPALKCSNGIVAVETICKEAVECIKCGRCVDVCPMELRPLYYTKYALSEDWEGMKTQNVMDCIECGCCEYICSSKIPIVERIKIGKTAIREGK